MDKTEEMIKLLEQQTNLMSKIDKKLFHVRIIGVLLLILLIALFCCAVWIFQ